ncbi:6-phosphogluconolactonase [Planctomycetes bacterium MalM25]|nr:6-phosphogluconolactonase [Planctomycetes bacterium MalM25]
MRLALSICLALATFTSAAEHDVWIGTKTGPDSPSRGVYHLTLDDAKGKLSPAKLVAEVEGPGWVTRHPSLSVLYTTRREEIVAWRIVRDEEGLRLEEINAEPTGDGGACHVSVDPTGRVLLSAQYGGGSVCSYRLNEDGAIAARVSHFEHEDPSNVVPGRQKACHPHWTGVSPDNRFVIAPDLGADRVYVHKLDAETGELSRHGWGIAIPGGGPRHFKFHPTLPVGYLVNELAMSLSVFDWNAERGELTLRQTIPTLSPEQIAGETFNSGSEVRVHPSGKFVYSANRGHDSITAFAVDPTTGELSLIEQEPIRGGWPRNFNLDPTGRWLLAAGHESNTLAVFAIDQETGMLQYTREVASVPAPICVHVE